MIDKPLAREPLMAASRSLAGRLLGQRSVRVHLPAWPKGGQRALPTCEWVSSLREAGRDKAEDRSDVISETFSICLSPRRR